MQAYGDLYNPLLTSRALIILIDIAFSISPAVLYIRTRRRGSKASGVVSPITLVESYEGGPGTVLFWVALWPRVTYRPVISPSKTFKLDRHQGISMKHTAAMLSWTT